MAKKSIGDLVGAWAFLTGVILAVLIGLLGTSSTLGLTVLVILGLIVGLLNVGNKEAKTFLLAGAILVIVSYMGSNTLSFVSTIKDIFVSTIKDIFDALLILFVPATIIVALKAVFSIAKS